MSFFYQIRIFNLSFRYNLKMLLLQKLKVEWTTLDTSTITKKFKK